MVWAHKEDILILTCPRGNELYAWLFVDTNKSHNDVLRNMSRLAADKELSFTLLDLVAMTKKMREPTDIDLSQFHKG